METSSATSSSLPRVLGIFPSLLPAASIYTIKPLTALAKQGKVHFDYAFEPKVSVEQVRASDLVIYCRNNDQSCNFTLEEARSLEIPTIYDIDDNFWEIPTTLATGRYHRSPARLRQYEHYLSQVSLVRTYNPIITGRVRQYNSHVLESRPCIDFSQIVAPGPDRTGGRISITYVTQRGARDELIDLFLPDIERILEEYPDLVELVMWHDCPAELKRYPNVRLHANIKDYDQFLRELSSAQYAIGLAPLLPTVFYLSKTNTKYRDYGACRIAGIYSDVPLYSSCVQDGVTGLLVSQQPGAWYNALTRLIKEPLLRRNIQQAAYQDVYDNYRQELTEAQWLELIDRLVLHQHVPLTRQTTRSSPAAAAPFQGTALALCVGGRVPAGFTGIGPHRQPGTGIIADLNAPLPLATSSVDRLCAHHSLARSDNPLSLLQEIQRVCRHGAAAALTLPYHLNLRNQADSNYHQLFSEHSARYWTVEPSGQIFPAEYTDQAGEPWGLAAPGDSLDLRPLRLEFFYTPAYRKLPAQQRREARQQSINVCDEILIHLMVVKQAISEEEMQNLKQQAILFEPVEVTLRRWQETVDTLNQQLELKQNHLDAQLDQVEKLQLNLDALGLEKDNQARKIVELTEAMNALKGQVSELAPLANRQAAEINEFKVRLQAQAEQIAFYEQKNSELLQKVALYESGGAGQPRSVDYWNVLPDAFQPLKDDTRTRLPDRQHYRLEPSLNLRDVSFIEYSIPLSRPNLNTVQLALRLDGVLTTGTVGIELVSPANQIVAHVRIQASRVTETAPVQFNFPAIAKSNQGTYRLRVFAREPNAPVHVLEFHRPVLLRLRKSKGIPFAAFGYA